MSAHLIVTVTFNIKFQKKLSASPKVIWQPTASQRNSIDNFEPTEYFTSGVVA
jgi:hypothetical protein